MWFPAAVFTSPDRRTRRVSNNVTVPSNPAAGGIVNWAGWTCSPVLVIAFEESFEELLVSNETAISSCKLALACADFLWSQDAMLRSLGLRLLTIQPGHTRAWL